MLEVDEDSRLGKEMLLGGARYGAADAPTDDQTAAFYETAVERLAALGIARYEISNFARPGCESRHNLKYWQPGTIRGFRRGRAFLRRARAPAKPRERRGIPGRRRRAESTAAHLEEERFFVGLRLMSGIRPEPAEWRRFERPIRRFLDAGLLETEDGTLRLTHRGVLLSNEVFQDFIN